MKRPSQISGVEVSLRIIPLIYPSLSLGFAWQNRRSFGYWNPFFFLFFYFWLFEVFHFILKYTFLHLIWACRISHLKGFKFLLKKWGISIWKKRKRGDCLNLDFRKKIFYCNMPSIALLEHALHCQLACHQVWHFSRGWLLCMPYCCLMISCSLESLRCYFVYSSGLRSSLGMIIKKGSCLEIGIFSLLFRGCLETRYFKRFVILSTSL